MEEKVAEAVVEAQSQEDTTILLLTKLAFERTMQALSLHTDKAETEKENILKCLADFLGIKLGDIKYDDSFAGESVLLHHDVALEAYKAVLRILILKEESITLERCRLLMRFVCNIGISLEDAYSILDETMKESDTDRLARNTSVMQDHRGLDRKDDTMIQRKRNVEIGSFTTSFILRRGRNDSVIFTLNLEAPEWVNCVENNVPSWLSALLFKSTLKNELREICRNHGKSESSFFCLDCHTAICLQCLREAHQEHKNIRVSCWARSFVEAKALSCGPVSNVKPRRHSCPPIHHKHNRKDGNEAQEEF